MERTRARRRGRATFIGGTLAAVLAAPLADAVRPGAGGLRPVAEQRYVVGPGDTLWSIALEIAPGHDPRPVVDAIARANQLTAGELSAGQSLLIPAVG